jgi:hypothetical protein
MSKRRKKKEKDIWEGYEPDWRELQASLEAEKEWKEQNPNFSMEDAADYYAELQGEIERGK